MAGGQEKWYFTKEQLQNSPSRKCGLDADKELAYRQQAANLIQDMGQRLQVSQLCINTAIVYMHRFYAFHSFTQFHRNAIAAAALFLAAKVEEQPRKLEYVIKVAHVCLHRGEGVNNIQPEQYTEQAQDLVFNENVLLQTLGFDVAIDHPHTHVVRTCHLVKAPKDLAQTSYFMASNSLHLTTMCLQYKPTVVACFCIHLASKWSNWAIPQSSEGRHWFSYVDRSVTTDLLEKLTAEFLHIFDKCPSRLKRKMMTMSNTSGSSPSGAMPSSSSTPFDKKHAPQQDDFDKSFDKEYERERRRQPVPGGYVPAPCGAAVPMQAASTGPLPPPAPPTAASAPNPPPPMKIDYNLYRENREKRDREERERQRQRGALVQGARPQTQQQPVSHQQRSSGSSSSGSSSNMPQQKPHHPWPHHKPPHKLPHDHRHHRPQPQAAATATTTNPQSAATATATEPPRTRPPSLFSPEAATTAPPASLAPPPTLAPPRRPTHQHAPRPKQDVRHATHDVKEKPEPPSPKKRQDLSTAVKEMQPPAILSPFSSPQLSTPVNKDVIKHSSRQRQLSNTEPELVPVVKKLDETPGYENVVRDSQRGLRTKAQEVNSMMNVNINIKQEKKDVANRLNGIETDPTLVSNLLKESLAKPAPITVPTEKPAVVEVKKEVVEPPLPAPPEIPPTEEHEHKPKKEKKKKEKHKHKDRDKSKEERKKHKKDKDRDKRKEPSSAAPSAHMSEGALRITIPRDGAGAGGQAPAAPAAPAPAPVMSGPGPMQTGLKIKIPKERLAAPPPPPNASSLKIKISKEVLDASRKRPAASESGPANKMSRTNGSHHNKVVETAASGHK